MSEWESGKNHAKKEAKELEGLIDGYSYRDAKHAEKTDELYREILTKDMRKCRDLIFPLIEAAYIEQDFKNAGALEDVMQWLDVFLLELGLKLEWNDMATDSEYETLIKTDLVLLNNTNSLVDILDVFQQKTLHGKAGSVVEKCGKIKKYVGDLLLLFKKRRHALGG